MCVSVRSAIAVYCAAFYLLVPIHIPVRRDDRQSLVRRDRCALRHEFCRERLRASIQVGHERDRLRRADRPHYVALDDADAQRMPAWPLLMTRVTVLGENFTSYRKF